jgi:hypothetical protein
LFLRSLRQASCIGDSDTAAAAAGRLRAARPVSSWPAARASARLAAAPSPFAPEPAAPSGASPGEATRFPSFAAAGGTATPAASSLPVPSVLLPRLLRSSVGMASRGSPFTRT